MTTLVDAPTRVDDVQLLGEMVGSGYRTPPSLVRRGDGQTLQLTPLLYAVLDAIDGRRSCAEIADAASSAMRRGISEEIVATLVDQKLRPMGLVKLRDGSQPPLKRSNPLLGLRFKLAVTNPRATRLITDPFRILFLPVVATCVVVAFLAITWWVFFDQGLAPAAYDAFQRPQLLLLVFVVTVLSGGFHEFGHAAAARYGGANPGVIGAGLYVVWPAFYTDVTDSYRLGRGGRVRTDLGGLYFNSVVVVLTFAWWYFTGWDALLLLVATQTMQMVQQLMPLLRFDGYHLLADLTGVPDLWHRIGPTLRGLLPHRWSDPEHRVLKPWARAVITLWVLVTIPMMALMLLALVAAIPRLIGTGWSVVHDDAAGVMSGWRNGGFIETSSHAVQILAVMLPLLGGLLIFGRVTLRSSRGLARWSRESRSRRVLAAALAAVIVTGLSWAWSQPGAYRPIVPGEDGRLTALLGTTTEGAPRPAPLDAVAAASGTLPIGAAAEQRLSSGAPLQATFQAGTTLPTKAEPQLAAVLVPSENTDTDAPPATDGSDEPWVFPFDQPLPPSEGDNQAAAYNTTDDSTKYDVAFALVWAEGNEVLNVNEAHAYASCSNCVTVAVAFQVVLIMDDAQVVVPQNLAVAANYQCYRCITAAIASQLVLSVEDEPGQEQLLALGEVWNRLIQFGQAITTYSLSEIAAQLDSFKSEIVAILDSAPPVETSTSPDSTSSATDGTTAGSDSGTESSTGSSPAPSEPSSSSEPAAPPPSEAPSDQTQPSSEPSSSPAPEQPSESPAPSTAPDTTVSGTTSSSTTSVPSTTP